MAGIRRQKKVFLRPAKPFETERIQEENKVKEKYGLKSKREIWKAEAQVRRLRGIAKRLITASAEKQEEFLNKLMAKGFLKSASKIDNVLDMKKEDYLERRLQTVVLRKSFAKSAKHARQLVTHRYIKIGDRIVNIPSYSVNLNEEKTIKLIPLKPKAEPKAVLEVKENAEGN